MRRMILASALLLSATLFAAPDPVPAAAKARPAAKVKPAAKAKSAAKPGAVLAGPQAAVTPVPRLDNKGWRERHESLKALAEKGDVDVMFIGDSITHRWENYGKGVWDKELAPLKAGNFGIGGDRTQHVLWRLDNGELPAALHPKVAVVMIGTNNAKDNKPAEVAAGITAIVDRLNAHDPKTRILLLAIFPRGAAATDKLRLKNTAVNALVAKLDGAKNVHYLDIGPKFLQPDGRLSQEIMPDLLHPEGKGYQIWADAVVPEIKKLLAE